MTPQLYHPAVPERAKSRQVQVDHFKLPHGTLRRLGNSDSTRNTRAVRVAARRTAIASVLNRQQRASRTEAARSLEHLPRRLRLHSEHCRTVRTVRDPTRQSVISSAPYDHRMGQTSEGHRISRARATPSGYCPVIGNHDKRLAST